MYNKYLIIYALFLVVACSADNYIGYQYLGAEYKTSPLGEEKSPDADPLIRFDAFDCTTFVETSLADGDIEKLNNIRYKDGEIDFLSRNHFIESDWLINNSDMVKNVSSLYGPTKIRSVTIDKQNWLKVVHNIDADFKTEKVNLEYIPYEDIKIIDTDKPLIVLFIVGNSEKYDKLGTDVAVVHMGFLLPDGRLRHASSQFGKVMDTDFYEYIKNKKGLGITLVGIK